MSAPAHRQLTPEAIRFRDLVITALWDDTCFGYVNEDRFVGTCPVCGLAVGVEFAGCAPRATLSCHGGCAEPDIAALLKLEVKS